MRIGPQRTTNPEALVVPHGYRVEALVTGLTFPSAISFGPGGELYLAESGGVAGSVVALPRVLRVDPDQSVTEIGRLDNPIVGLVYRQGELLIGEDGPAPRVLRVTAEGEVQILVETMPGGGDYGLSGFALDPSGALLFGLGTRTNSGVVGLDNVARGWVARHPEWADVPGADVTLEEVNYVTSQPTAGGAARVVTGAFKPYGHRCGRNEQVRGAQRCGGAVYRMPIGAAEPERLAWGLRNPVGVACGPDGRVFASEGGMEERGSRPIAGAPDNLWEIQPGGYYGWPDHASGIAVNDARFRLPGHPTPSRLLRQAPAVAGSPAATFPARSGVGRLDFSRAESFGFPGEVFIALSGPWSLPAFPANEPEPAPRIVRVDLRSGQATDFLTNRHGGQRAAGGEGLERPFDVQFDPSGEILYVVDLGEVRLDRENGLEAFGGTGVVWRITRARPMLQVPAKQGRRGAPAERAEEPEERETEAEEPQAEEPGAGEPGAETFTVALHEGEDVAREAATLPEDEAPDEPEEGAPAEGAAGEAEGTWLGAETPRDTGEAEEAGEEEAGEEEAAAPGIAEPGWRGEEPEAGTADAEAGESVERSPAEPADEPEADAGESRNETTE